ncbi:MAG TPA: hypothetical protein VGE52_22150, partial [Pirellulales bacterium]
MKSLSLALLLVAAVGFSSILHAEEGEVPGVEGNTFLIEKDQENMKTVDDVQVFEDDEIQINWTYPVVPGFFPEKVEAKSSSGAVKFLQSRNIVRTDGRVGASTLATRFEAKKPGKSTITVMVKST